MRIILLFLIIYSFNCYAASNYIDKLDPYFNNLKSVAINFVQTDSKNTSATGIFLINKPFKFRCNYFSPAPLLVVGNKDYVSVYDYEMETLSRIKNHENNFNFLLIDKIDLAKYFSIELLEDTQNYFKMKFYHLESQKNSIITFNKLNTQISEIKIYENDNVITLNFDKIRKVAKFDEDLFIIKSPKIFGSPKQYNAIEIEKKITAY